MRGRPSNAPSRSRWRGLPSMSRARSFRGVAMRLIDREFAAHGGALADGGIDAHLAAVQFDKGAHQRQAKAGAAMPGAVGMALEPVEYPILELRRNARATVGHG